MKKINWFKRTALAAMTAMAMYGAQPANADMDEAIRSHPKGQIEIITAGAEKPDIDLEKRVAKAKVKVKGKNTYAAIAVPHVEIEKGDKKTSGAGDVEIELATHYKIDDVVGDADLYLMPLLTATLPTGKHKENDLCVGNGKASYGGMLLGTLKGGKLNLDAGAGFLQQADEGKYRFRLTPWLENGQFKVGVESTLDIDADDSDKSWAFGPIGRYTVKDGMMKGTHVTIYGGVMDNDAGQQGYAANARIRIPFGAFKK